MAYLCLIKFIYMYVLSYTPKSQTSYHYPCVEEFENKLNRSKERIKLKQTKGSSNTSKAFSLWKALALFGINSSGDRAGGEPSKPAPGGSARRRRRAGDVDVVGVARRPRAVVRGGVLPCRHHQKPPRRVPRLPQYSRRRRRRRRRGIRLTASGDPRVHQLLRRW